MEISSSTLLAAAPADLLVEVAEYPVNDAGRWMQNRLDVLDSEAEWAGNEG